MVVVGYEYRYYAPFAEAGPFEYEENIFKLEFVLDTRRYRGYEFSHELILRAGIQRS